MRELLDDDDPRVALEAVKALGKTGDKGSLPEIIKVLKEHDEGAVRDAAAEALGRIGDKKAVDPLIEALADENKQILFSVTQALVALGDPKAVTPLKYALKTEKGSTVRIWVAEALARFDTEEGYEFLREAIGSGDESDVKHAMLGVVNIPGEKSLEILKESFESESAVVRKYAAFSAHQKSDSDVMPQLVEVLNDDDIAVRYGAVMSLRILGFQGKPVTEILEKHRLKEEDEEVKRLLDESLELLEQMPPE
jgi:HEAT repeat protein